MMVRRPLVSIIGAVYNGERFLREALESAVAQEYDPFEVILVDDGSEDASAEIAAGFPDVRYLRQENRGLPSARNAGLAVARGDLIAFLDDDDVLPPTKLAVQAGYLEEHPNTGCVLGRQEWIFEGSDPPEWLKRDPIYDELGGIAMVSAMIRKSALDRIGGFDPTYEYAEDRDLFVRMREAGVEIVVLPDVVLYKRLHGSNMTFAQPAKHPLLRSLKGKVDRERARIDGS